MTEQKQEKLKILYSEGRIIIHSALKPIKYTLDGSTPSSNVGFELLPVDNYIEIGIFQGQIISLQEENGPLIRILVS